MKSKGDVVDGSGAFVAIAHDGAVGTNLSVLTVSPIRRRLRALVNRWTVLMRVNGAEEVREFMCHDKQIPVPGMVISER
jgi:hypothetical protein